MKSVIRHRHDLIHNLLMERLPLKDQATADLAHGLECSVCGSPGVGVNRRRKPPGPNMRILTLLTSALLVAYASLVSAASMPAPPRVPRNFRWKGRYLVKDLGVDVPFSWQGKDGNLQMIAGSNGEDAIYFTNVLFDNELYTVTYRWPGIVLPDPVPCVCLGGLTLEKLNGCLSTSRYVGSEILADRSVKLANHFRISVVLGDTELKPDPVRIPIMQGDFYMSIKGIQPSSGKYCILDFKISWTQPWTSGSC